MGVRLTTRGKVALAVAGGLVAMVAGAGLAELQDRGAFDGLLDAAANSSPTASPQATATDAPTGSSDPTAGSSPKPSPRPEPAKGTARWRVPAAEQARNGEIEAYADAAHLKPGKKLGLHVSTTAKRFTVKAYRIGDYGGLGATRVGTYGPFRGQVGKPPTTDPQTGAVSANWPAAAQISTKGWEPGLYLLGVWTTGANPKRATVPVVLTSPDATDRIVLVAGDTTWQAYNSWGGADVYRGRDGTFATRSRAVSFNRPYSWSGYRWPAAFDIPLIRLAESLDVPLAYASVTSVTAEPDSLLGALGILTNGHDEYWTQQYRQALLRARDKGANLGFMGANQGYWKTVIKDRGRTAWIPKTQSQLRWRDDAAAVPENAIVGQLYDCYPAKADVVIQQPKFFLFAGTGVKRGSRIRNLAGIETDRVYPLDSTPRPIQIPAMSQITCNGNRTWSTIAYYTTPSGAGVFSAGTNNWVRAMGGPRGDQQLGDDALKFTRKATANLIRAMAAGPMGFTHAAQDNLDELDLPANITSGTVPETPANPNLP